MDKNTYLKVKQIALADWRAAVDDLTRHIPPAPTNVNLVRMVNDDPKTPSNLYHEAFQALIAFERNRSQPKGTVAGIPDRKRTAAQATKDMVDDFGRLLDMIGQAVNTMGAEPSWPVYGTLASSRQTMIDVLVHVGDLDEKAIKETLDEMRDDGTGAQAGGA